MGGEVRGVGRAFRASIGQPPAASPRPPEIEADEDETGNGEVERAGDQLSRLPRQKIMVELEQPVHCADEAETVFQRREADRVVERRSMVGQMEDRSEERRVGKECDRTCKYGWGRDH